MKRHLPNRTLLKSTGSLLVLGLVLITAIGSNEYLKDLTELYELIMTYDSETNTYEEECNYFLINTVVKGEKDSYLVRNGKYRFEYTYEHWLTGDKFTVYELANMKNGKRHGKCLYEEEGETITRYYVNGIPTTKEYWDEHWDYYGIWKYAGEQLLEQTEQTAFQMLSEKYPWFIFALHGIGYDSVNVQAYMDTLESILYQNSFDQEDFNDYYDEAVEALSETPYDSIIGVNAFLSYLQGLEGLKDNELRRAVIDRYRTQGSSTYNILEVSYPGYIRVAQEGEVTSAELKAFCDELDNSMNSYGALDESDPFFVDSIDAQLDRAIFEILDSGESTDMKSAIFFDNIPDNHRKICNLICNKYRSELREKSTEYTPADVAQMVLYILIMQYLEGDLIENTVYTNWLDQNQIPYEASTLTAFLGNNSASSVTLLGNVYSDGGADVTARGIAWASHYNPSIVDQVEAAGSGLGDFELTVDGLTEGNTYYARSYATNSMGTAYGNCISFKATSTTSLFEKEDNEEVFTVYPNPATDRTTLDFWNITPGKYSVWLVDMSGRVVRQFETGTLSAGEQRIILDLSGLPAAVYHCQLRDSNQNTQTQRLVIVP